MLTRVTLTPALREYLLAPFCHRVELGESISLFELENPAARVLVAHRTKHGTDPAWVLQNGELREGNYRESDEHGRVELPRGDGTSEVLAVN